MSALADTARYARFVRGLHTFLRQTISLDEASAMVRRRMGRREANFLQLVERSVFDYPRSPCGHLLKLAGCERGDLQSMVQASGLEATLRT